MPRPLVFGNGAMLVGIDEQYVLRDLYYPQVGHPNHLNGHPIRMGFWVGGKFAWTSDPGWRRELRYEPGTLVGDSQLYHAELGLRVRIQEAVCPTRNHFLRRMEVHNLQPGPVEVRTFFSHDLRLAENDVGDTAFFHPFVDAMIHYKGPHYLLFGGQTAHGGIDQYATGIKAFGGMEGTWRDAEDGHLSMNPIAQGSVDSTFSLRTTVPPAGAAEVLYWVVAGRDLPEVERGYRELIERGVQAELEDARRYWSAWSHRKIAGMSTLPVAVQELFTQSLLIVRTQIDNQGAVIAANDTDIMETNRATYSYMWPRDGALVSLVMDRVGYEQLARRFFDFCCRVIAPDRPVLMHKYGPDGTLGASWHPWVVDGHAEVPFQEDETALTIHTIGEHYRHHQDLEFLRELWDRLVAPACDFMERYRDPRTGLPLPSWDLWEERRGVHAFTLAALVQAFRSAAEMADALGDRRALRYANTADELVEAVQHHLWHEGHGAYVRRLEVLPDGTLVPDFTVDAAILNLALFGVVPVDHPRMQRTIERITERLRVQSPVGGMARYEGDYYFRRSDRYPGNPWVICTLWLAQVRIRQAKTHSHLKEPLQWLEWTTRMAAPTGVLPEQVDPDTGAMRSVAPLTWSHAEFLQTVLEYLAKVQELDAAAATAPGQG